MKLLSNYALLNNLEGAEGKRSAIFPVAIYGFEICSVTTFLLPTDAHNVKKHRVIKTF